MTHATLVVVFTRHAARQIEEANAWWHRNRLGAPDAIVDELERATRLVASHPAAGAPARAERLRGVRRVLLARVGYHLYYRVRPRLRRIEVLRSGLPATSGS